ncbi:MAG: 3-deoxy-D-manno-octulosonic acid transferase [Planctomycetota bacterium]
MPWQRPAYSLLFRAAYAGAWPVLALRRMTNPKFRDEMRQRLGDPGFTVENHPRAAKGVVWIHAASVGELAAGEPVIKALMATGGFDVVLSTTTVAGRDLAKKRFPGLAATFLLPLDLPGAVDRTFSAVRPRCLVLLETEIWPNLLWRAARDNTPVVILNGRVSPRSFRRYRLVRGTLAAALPAVRAFGMRSAADADRIRTLGAPPDRVTITGNMKFDQARMTAAALRDTPPSPESLLVAGSTHPGEEKILLGAFATLRETHPDLRLVLVPRHITRAGAVTALVKAAGLRFALFTHARDRRSWPEVLVVDTLGDLPRLFAQATIVFIGGSLVPHGGHNLLEPAALGRPVLFGPHMENFEDETRAVLATGGGLRIRDGRHLSDALAFLLANDAEREHMGEDAEKAVRTNLGAVARNMGLLEQYL